MGHDDLTTPERACVLAAQCLCKSVSERGHPLCVNYIRAGFDWSACGTNPRHPITRVLHSHTHSRCGHGNQISCGNTL